MDLNQNIIDKMNNLISWGLTVEAAVVLRDGQHFHKIYEFPSCNYEFEKDVNEFSSIKLQKYPQNDINGALNYINIKCVARSASLVTRTSFQYLLNDLKLVCS